MSIFAEKAKSPQNAAPARAEIPARGFRQSPEVSSVLYRSPEPGVAHLDAQGGELQEERSTALQTGRNPDDPENSPRDAIRKALREAAANPPIRPGSWSQQELMIPWVNPGHLWFLPRIQERMRALAEMEARERVDMGPKGKINHTVESRMEHWEPKFRDSVNYVLYIREGDKQDKRLKELHVQEAALVKSAPANLIEQVEALRRTHQQTWQEEVDRAADRFVILANNEAQFATVRQKASPVAVYGLPEDLEGTVTLTDHKDTLAQGPDARPVAPSVVVFMKEVQKQTGTKVIAANYADHESFSPRAGPEKVGKYSIDVYPWIKADAEGFYEHEPVVKFFLAADRAATATNVAWMAYYNDFAVAKEVNEKLGKLRIKFSGAHDGPGGKGSIHHGPAPYLLHIHFNIMPTALAEKYFADKEEAKKKAKKDTKP